MKELLKEYIGFILNEKSGEGGAEYETIVFNAIKAAGASGRMMHTAGFDASLPDADITINGSIYNIEVKMNGNAQMGGGSIGMKNGEFFAAGKDIEAMEPIAQSLNSSPDAPQLIDSIEKFCLFLNRKGKGVGKPVDGFPMSGFSTAAWKDAVEAGLLVPINRKLESSVGFISKHYASKGTSYIQIGGQGLFSLLENPANLPIPKLSGSVVLEVRAARAGSGGRPTSSAGIRVQPRLKISEKSPYTLDDPESIRNLLNAVSKTKKRKK